MNELSLVFTMRLKRLVSHILPPVVAAIVVIIIWEISVEAFHVQEYVLPPPSSVFNAILSPRAPWGPHILATFSTALLGLFVGVVGGMSLAIAMNLSELFRRVVLPYIIASQLIPKVALAPLLFVLLGFGDLPRIAIAFLITFFPMVVNTAAGLNSASPEIFDIVQALRATSWQTLRKVKLPSALPYIFAGLKVSVTLALIGVIVSEFVYSSRGLGHLILLAQTYMDTAMIFATMFILFTLGFLLFASVLLAERVLLPWHIEPRRSRGMIQG
jgi:NitT/TauT family transport system permease protein